MSTADLTALDSQWKYALHINCIRITFILSKIFTLNWYMKIDSVLIKFHIKYAELILKLEKKINTHVIILTHIIDYMQKRGCRGHDQCWDKWIEKNPVCFSFLFTEKLNCSAKKPLHKQQTNTWISGKYCIIFFCTMFVMAI